jgi:hypothetical protein
MAREREKSTMVPKLENTEVSLSELLGLINSARKPVLAAIRSEEEEPTLSFTDMRKFLADAYFALGGERSTLDRNTEIGSRRLLPYLLVNYGAQNLQRIALEVLQEGESPEMALVLLDRCRELTFIIERHLFGQAPPKDVPKVVDFLSRKALQQSRAEVA